MYLRYLKQRKFSISFDTQYNLSREKSKFSQKGHFLNFLTLIRFSQIKIGHIFSKIVLANFSQFQNEWKWQFSKFCQTHRTRLLTLEQSILGRKRVMSTFLGSARNAILFFFSKCHYQFLKMAQLRALCSQNAIV
jgi:hypothetical protein